MAIETDSTNHHTDMQTQTDQPTDGEDKEPDRAEGEPPGEAFAAHDAEDHRSKVEGRLPLIFFEVVHE